MELPEDILQIIREYSKPVTRPDWRSMHLMRQYTLHIEFERQMFRRFKKLNIDYGLEFLQLLSNYKPLFDEPYYNHFKTGFNNFI